MAKDKKSAREQRQEIANIANHLANDADQCEHFQDFDTIDQFTRMCDLLKNKALRYHEYLNEGG